VSVCACASCSSN